MAVTYSGAEVEVIRKKIKQMHLYVLPPDGRLKVTAPMRISEAKISAFVMQYSDWIDKQRKKLAAMPPPPTVLFVSGEKIRVWGEEYSLDVAEGKNNSLILCGEKALFTVRAGSTPETRAAFVKEWYRSILKEKISQRLPVWESAAGLHCSDWQTKYMKTRWGTCNTTTGRLWFNVYLAKEPERRLDYVILHELTHLRTRGHNREFYSFIERFMPDWKQQKKCLSSGVDK